MPDTPTNAPVVPDANAQAKAALPQPKLAEPWEDEPRLPASDKLSKAYDAAKSWLSDHEQHLSDKYLAPFRQGLDNMAQDLQDAGESGHTKSGGQLSEPTRALAEGTGALLKQVPVGKNIKETAEMAITNMPELPEGHMFSHIEGVRFAPAAEEAEKVAERLPKKSASIPSERHTGEFHETVKQGGAIPGGIQKGDPEIKLPDLVLFHDPITGSTLALPAGKVSADAVKEQISKSRQQYLDAEDRAVNFKPVTKNASGESAASQEAINRAASQKTAGITHVRRDTRSGKETPISNMDAADAKAGPYDQIVQKKAGGETILDSGAKARPVSGQLKPIKPFKVEGKPDGKYAVEGSPVRYATRHAAETEAYRLAKQSADAKAAKSVVKPFAKIGDVKQVSKLASDYLATLKK